MNPTRHLEAIRALNATLRKVFEATPVSEAWSVHEINGELVRCGKRLEMSMLVGCLNALKKDGLIREPEAGRFIQVPITPKVKPPQTQEATMSKIKAPPADPLEELSDLAQELLELSAKAEAIGNALRAKVVEIEAKHEQFKQLQALLKGLT